MRHLYFLALLLPLLVGGSNISVENMHDQYIFHWIGEDSTVTDGDTTSHCTGTALAAAATPIWCIFPPGPDILLTHFGVTLTADTEDDCTWMVITGENYVSAAGDVESSAIATGDVANAAGTCRATEELIDDIAEGCTRGIDPTDADALIVNGGWWAVIANDADGGGTCNDAMHTMFLRGVRI